MQQSNCDVGDNNCYAKSKVLLHDTQICGNNYRCLEILWDGQGSREAEKCFPGCSTYGRMSCGLAMYIIIVTAKVKHREHFL